MTTISEISVCADAKHEEYLNSIKLQPELLDLLQPIVDEINVNAEKEYKERNQHYLEQQQKKWLVKYFKAKPDDLAFKLAYLGNYCNNIYFYPPKIDFDKPDYTFTPEYGKLENKIYALITCYNNATAPKKE